MRQVALKIFSMAIAVGCFAVLPANASPISIAPSAFKTPNATIILAHSWKEQEDQRKLGTIGTAKGQRRFEHEGGGWRDFKRRFRRDIRRFKNRQFPKGSLEKGAYYYYNYKYGYIRDNCEFIREPVRFCWYEENGKRQCQWRMKWQYACY